MCVIVKWEVFIGNTQCHCASISRRRNIFEEFKLLQGSSESVATSPVIARRTEGVVAILYRHCEANEMSCGNLCAFCMFFCLDCRVAFCLFISHPPLLFSCFLVFVRSSEVTGNVVIARRTEGVVAISVLFVFVWIASFYSQ